MNPRNPDEGKEDRAPGEGEEDKIHVKTFTSMFSRLCVLCTTSGMNGKFFSTPVQ
jgi:hypothetical protein